MERSSEKVQNNICKVPKFTSKGQDLGTNDFKEASPYSGMSKDLEVTYIRVQILAPALPSSGILDKALELPKLLFHLLFQKIMALLQGCWDLD